MVTGVRAHGANVKVGRKSVSNGRVLDATCAENEVVAPAPCAVEVDAVAHDEGSDSGADGSHAAGAGSGSLPNAIPARDSEAGPDILLHDDDPFDVAEDAADVDDAGELLPPVGRRDLKAEAQTIEHQLLHAHKNPNCPVCVRAFGPVPYTHLTLPTNREG